jgi:hypothetical protein
MSNMIIKGMPGHPAEIHIKGYRLDLASSKPVEEDDDLSRFLDRLESGTTYVLSDLHAAFDGCISDVAFGKRLGRHPQWMSGRATIDGVQRRVWTKL